MTTLSLRKDNEGGLLFWTFIALGRDWEKGQFYKLPTKSF